MAHRFIKTPTPGLVTRNGRRAPLIPRTPRQQAEHAQAMEEARAAFAAYVDALPLSRGGKKVDVRVVSRVAAHA